MNLDVMQSKYRLKCELDGQQIFLLYMCDLICRHDCIFYIKF